MADFKFDLENFVRVYLDLQKEKGWDGNVEENYWAGAVYTILDQGRGLDEFLQEHTKVNSQSVKDVLNFLSGVQKNQNVDDIKNTIKFVAEQVFCPKNNGNSRGYGNTPYVQMFLNRLNQFKDKDLVYEALKSLKSVSDYKRPGAEQYGLPMPKQRMSVYKDIATMLANNQNATIDDILEMIYFADTPDAAMKIINDVFAKTDEDLDIELNKDVPGTDTVGSILNKPRFVVRTVLDRQGLNPELSKQMGAIDSAPIKEFYKQLAQWEKIATEKYDFDKVIGSGDTQYVTNYENTLEEQNIGLVNTNERLSADNFRLTQSRDQYRENYEHEKELRARLLKKFEDERAAVSSLNEMLQSALAVIAAYENGERDVDKAGVFNKAAAKVKMKEQVEKANADLKRAREREEKRKAALAARQLQEGQAISI